MVTTTTIKVSEKTKKLLDAIKIHPRETYDDILKRLIKLIKDENDN